jgi:hypothetical protein
MKKIILILGLALSFIATPALANCPSGNCAVEVNCTTGVVTYTDAPIVNVTAPVISQPVAPTNMVVVQTANSSFGTSGSLEQVQQAVQQLITAPQAPQADPCALGGCNKIIVNATTGVTEILPLSSADIQQRLVDQYMNYARQLEMSIAAREAIIQTYVAPIMPTVANTVTSGSVATAVATTLSVGTLSSAFAITPSVKKSTVIMATKNGIKVTKKEDAKALIRKKKK